MSNQAPRRFVSLIGFVAGAGVFGPLFWGIGYYGWVEPTRHAIGPILAFITVLVFPMSLVAPLALVRYLGRNLEGASRWGVMLLGYALLVGFTFAMAYLELFQAMGITTAEETMAFFAAVFGVTFGGIVGAKVALRAAGKGIGTGGTDWEEEPGSGWDR